MILIDTTPLVALCDPRDALHERALSDLAHVKRTPLVVCEPVLTETGFLLPHAVQRERLARLLAELPVKSVGSEVDDIRGAVFGWLAKYAEHEPDWADGTLVVLSARIAGAKVWTYDAEFATTWRGPNGKRVPLFVDPRRTRRLRALRRPA